MSPGARIARTLPIQSRPCSIRISGAHPPQRRLAGGVARDAEQQHGQAALACNLLDPPGEQCFFFHLPHHNHQARAGWRSRDLADSHSVDSQIMYLVHRSCS
jgi:hypothetical protein